MSASHIKLALHLQPKFTSSMDYYARYKTQDFSEIFKFIKAFPFACIAKNNVQNGVPDIVNVPVISVPESQSFEFHIAKENAALENFEVGGKICIQFPGPNSHISPLWYEGEDLARAAPTWNYALAEITGTVKAMPDEVLESHLERLVSNFETAQGWRMDGLNSELLQRWKSMIKGFYISIETAEATFKLSQDRHDRNPQVIRSIISSIIKGLRARGLPMDSPLASFMEKYYGLDSDG